MIQQNRIIDQAKLLCVRQKERLTKPRLEVLKIIAMSSKPMGAYAILKKLGKVIDSPKPPTVYRAIKFWQQKGFIHRIESLNAYITSSTGHQHQSTQFMICNNCGVVIETNICDLAESLKNSTINNKFKPLSWNLEIHGLCAQCQSE